VGGEKEFLTPHQASRGLTQFHNEGQKKVIRAHEGNALETTTARSGKNAALQERERKQPEKRRGGEVGQEKANKKGKLDPEGGQPLLSIKRMEATGPGARPPAKKISSQERGGSHLRKKTPPPGRKGTKNSGRGERGGYQKAKTLPVQKKTSVIHENGGRVGMKVAGNGIVEKPERGPNTPRKKSCSWKKRLGVNEKKHGGTGPLSGQSTEELNESGGGKKKKKKKKTRAGEGARRWNGPGKKRN